MEWFAWVAPIFAILGVIITAAVGYYRIGQNEKRIDQVKLDQEKRCENCQAARKEQRAVDDTKIVQNQVMINELMKMHTAQVMSNSTEHNLINVSAARTEEQLKNVLAKIEELAHAVHRIERDMPRDYRPSPDTGHHRKG